MARFLALFLIPLALLLAAGCGNGDSDKDSDPTTEPVASATSGDGADSEATVEPTDVDGSDSSASSDLLGSLSPFTLLSSVDASASTEAADPELAALLLSEGDLPDGFTSQGDFGQSVPTDEYGMLDMAANVFSTSEPGANELGSVVMSAAVALSPEAKERISDFKPSDGDLDELTQGAGELGGLISDVRLLDADGLGDEGFGFHLVMDFGALMEAFTSAFGTPEEGAEDIPSAFSMDAYMFVDGDNMLMVMVMSDGSTDVDARELADVLNANAS